MTIAVDVLCDKCVTLTNVRFSGGPSTEKTRKKDVTKCL